MEQKIPWLSRPWGNFCLKFTPYISRPENSNKSATQQVTQITCITSAAIQLTCVCRPILCVVASNCVPRHLGLYWSRTRHEIEPYLL